jgi:YVTN family beta-propeller protein
MSGRRRLGMPVRMASRTAGVRCLSACAALAVCLPFLVLSGTQATAESAATAPAGLRSIALTSIPDGVAVDPVTDTAYVTVRGTSGSDGDIVVINLAKDSITATIQVGQHPTGIAVDPDTDVIYAINYLSDTVSVVSGATNSVTATITGITSRPKALNGIAVDPATNRIYVGVDPGSVAVISGATDAVTDTVTSGASFPEAVALNPVTDTVYAAFGFTSRVVLVISGTTDTVTDTISTEPPDSVAVDAATNTFYVGAAGVTAYSGITNGVTGSIGDGGGVGLAVNPDTGIVCTTPSVGADAYLLSGKATKVLATIPLTDSGWTAVDPDTDTFVVTTATPGVAVIALRAPAFTSPDHAAFRVGVRQRFVVHTTGFPAVTVTEHGRLPQGLRFAAGKNGTAVISGKAARSARGKRYVIELIAGNAVRRGVIQRLTLRIT